MTDAATRLSSALADRYRIERELGAGGMATVYLARDLRHDRQVAIKVLHADLAHALGADRFEREIKLAARLSHPHILSLHDSGSADGFLYYVMPYVEGESLRTRIAREGVLPVADAVDIAREVADALGYAHSMGIVHRDIKPDNILLSRGHALLADFGIARAVAFADAESLTRTGTSIGTPQYMSPEQALGDPVGPASDVYSLGCVLYEMLTGSPPFTGSSSQAVLARHTTDPVLPLRTVRKTIPEAVEAVVIASLNKLPADRPKDAAEFRNLLTAAVGSSGTPTPSGGLGTPVVHRRVPAAPRHARLVLIAIALALLAALGVWRLRTASAPSAVTAANPAGTRLAVLYFADLSQRHDLAFVADGLTNGLIDALSEVKGLTVVSRGGVSPYRGSSIGRDSIARALQVGTLVIGSVEREGDGIRVTVRLVDDGGVEIDHASFKRASTDLVGLADSLSTEAARLIRQRLGRSVELSRTRSGTRSTDAWSFYQRGVRAWNRGDSLFASGDGPGWDREYVVADSLAQQAEHLDGSWAEPSILRGLLEYWRSRRAPMDSPELMKHIAAGMKHVTRALKLNHRDPDALELRGDLQYWRWLARIDTASDVRSSLLAAAQRDFEAAANATPPRAGAWASLSHLYYQLPSKTMLDIQFAAAKALELDAWLANAEVIYSRLIFASYDAEKLDEAARWCDEAHHRFPSNARFYECSLWVAFGGGRQVSPPVARAILDSTLARTPDEALRKENRLEGTVLLAGILARAGQRDSARRLLRVTPDDSTADPLRETLGTRAYAWLLAGDRDQALATLKVYYDIPAGRRPSSGSSWWYREIANDRRYLALLAREHQ